MKLVIVSICKDEGETMAELLDRMPKKIQGINEIERLIVSDGSTDDTVKIAREKGVEVIAGTSQRRLAKRFAQAADKALAMGADVMVNIDGDLQFKPEQIPELVQPILDGEADFVAADRFTDLDTGKKVRPEHMPVGKYYANQLGAKIVGWLSGYKFNDVTCGFRAYTREALSKININAQYTYTQESFQVLAMKKMAIKSVPVEIKYYPGRKSRVVTSFTKFLFGSALNILKAFRDYAPLTFFGITGAIPFIIGSIAGIFVGINWLRTGAISPYKAVGFMAIYLVTMGLILWMLGLVADMMDRLSNNQEKILERLKRIEYDK